MIVGFSGYDGLPVTTDHSPEAQLVQQAIVPLGDQMKSAGRDYLQATGQGGSYYLITAEHLDSDQNKRMAIGAAVGLAFGGLVGFLVAR